MSPQRNLKLESIIVPVIGGEPFQINDMVTKGTVRGKPTLTSIN
jgi:hypothetical protein